MALTGKVLLTWDPSPGPGLDPAGGGEPEGGQTPSAPQTNSKATHCPKSSPHDPEQAPDNINCSHMGFDLKSTGMFRCWPPDPANASPLLRTDPRSPPGTNSEQRGLCLCLWISSRQRLDTNLGVCWGLPGPKPGQAAMAAASACQPEAQHVMALPGLTIKFKRVCRYCRVSRPSESPGNICTHR